jgi:hypothetical protein
MALLYSQVAEQPHGDLLHKALISKGAYISTTCQPSTESAKEPV